MSDVIMGLSVITGISIAMGLVTMTGVALLRWLESALPGAIRYAQSWVNYILGPEELRCANPRLDGYLSVDEIITGMGIAPTKDLTWAVGRRARDWYAERYQRPPVKALRPKTSGQGSHDKAVFAPMLVPHIEGIVRDEALLPQPGSNT